jgi:hypothetical protein
MYVRDEVIVDKMYYIHYYTNNSKLGSNCPPLEEVARSAGGVLSSSLCFIHPRLSGFPLPAYRRQAKGDKIKKSCL